MLSLWVKPINKGRENLQYLIMFKLITPKKQRITTAVFLIFFAIVAALPSLQAQPCFTGYQYRIPVILNNTANSALSDHQLMFTVNTSTMVSAGKMQSSGNDLRFLDKKGNELKYWVATGTMNTTSTQVWVRVDSVYGYQKDTLYMFFGNATASVKSNASSTFLIYDEFNGSSLSSTWTTCGSGSISVNSGALKLNPSSNTSTVKSVLTFKAPLIIEAVVSSHTGGRAMMAQVNTSNNGYGMTLSGTTMSIESISNSTSTCYTTSGVTSTTTTSGVGDWEMTWGSTASQSAVWSSGSLSSSSSTYSLPISNRIILQNTGSGLFEIDFIRVRKYKANLPSITYGVEANTSYTISPMYKSPLCEGGTLELIVDSIVGAVYKWTGPNGYASNLQNPKITGVGMVDSGRYDVVVSIPTGCASKTSSVNVNISPKAKGGIVSGSQTVCYNSNSGTLSLSAYTGNVTNWEYRTSTTGSWSTIANTGLNQTYSNLTVTTYYRAIVSNGNCSSDSSSIATITVATPSVGGSLTGADSVCFGTNSGVISLSGQTGNVIRWESSENDTLWTPIINKGTSHGYSNLTTTTHYRAIVQNSVCNPANSSVVIIHVDKSSIGGSVTGVAAVCPGTNQGTMYLTGHRGSVLRWESALAGSSTWNAISGTSDSLTFTNLTSNTLFRAIVANGQCASTQSSSRQVNIHQASSSGTITGGATVCEGVNSGVITLTQNIGIIEKWQKNGGSGWSDISNTTTLLTWQNLNDTTMFRSLVANNGCAADTSASVTVNVNPQSQGGYLTGTNAVCETGNTYSVSLNSNVGDVQRWESSVTGYSPWTPIAHTATTYQATNLTTTTHFRVVVKSGVCSQVGSGTHKITVDVSSDPGIVDKNAQVCANSNFGILNLIKYTGIIEKWETATSLAGPWTSNYNTTPKQEYINIPKTTYYRAHVKNGVCASETSSVAVVVASENTVGGVAVGNKNFCGTTNSGFIELVAHKGDVLSWEKSTDLKNWSSIAIANDTITYVNLAETTHFRSVVKNGACGIERSSEVMVQVAANSNAGILFSDQDEVCSGYNFGTISLNSYVGDITSWETKKGTGLWMKLNSTSANQVFYNLTETVSYRVLVKNEFCSVDTSATYVIGVSEQSVAGEITGDLEICAGSSDAVLVLKNHTGTITNWSTATTQYGPWVESGTTTDSFILTKPTQTIFVRAEVANGVCVAARTQLATVKVYEPTASGTVLGAKDICLGTNDGMVELVGHTGMVKYWEYSTQKNPSWIQINSTTTTINYKDLTDVTLYRAFVQNGTCAGAYSTNAAITNYPMPVVAFVNDQLCDGRIVGFKENTSIATGSITAYKWLFSDGFASNQDQFDKTFNFPGKYTVQLTAQSDRGCETTFIQDIVVSESPMALFDTKGAIAGTSLCLNEAYTFENLTSFTDFASLDHLWNFGDGITATTEDASHAFATAGLYPVTLTVTARSGCTDSYSSNVTVLEENKPRVSDDVTISLGTAHQLFATGSITYEWSPAEFLTANNIPNPIARVTETTTFTVVGTDYFGCKSSADVTLSVEADYKVVPNNVITPDGNGGNDVWVIKNLENYPDNKVAIYDRWGRVVYEQTAYANDWGATNVNGSLLMDGTYYYVLEFPETGEVLKGAITVIRNK
ncbi:MAG: gliding motility-associated-like protein [Bacteroidia bacterium]